MATCDGPCTAGITVLVLEFGNDFVVARLLLPRWLDLEHSLSLRCALSLGCFVLSSHSTSCVCVIRRRQLLSGWLWRANSLSADAIDGFVIPFAGPAGTYGNSATLSTSGCTAPCPDGQSRTLFTVSHCLCLFFRCYRLVLSARLFFANSVPRWPLRVSARPAELVVHWAMRARC